MLKRSILCLLLSFSCFACGDDDGGNDDDASTDEDATVGMDAMAGEDAEPGLPGCELFGFTPDPPEAGADFEVSVSSPEGYTNVDLELDGPGSPSATFISSDTEGDSFVWSFSVTGHENGELTMTFTAVNGAANVARCVYNIGGDNPEPDAAVPDAGVDADSPDMDLPDMNVPDMNPPTTGAYLESGGLIVFEIESTPAATGWAEETGLNGFTGTSYYTWKGGNQLARANAGMGTLKYDIRVSDAGEYRFRIRNRHDRADATMDNDCWVRLDGGTWVKLFSSQRGAWVYASNHEFSATDKQTAKYQLSAGDHTIEISGRSQNFSIDRVHLYKLGTPNAEDPSQPVSAQSN